MIHITEFATEPQKTPLTPRINSVPLQIRENAIAIIGRKMKQDF